MNLFMILTIFHPRQLSQIEQWTSAMMAWVTRPLALSLPQLEKTSWSISQESQKKKHIHEWGDGLEKCWFGMPYKRTKPQCWHCNFEQKGQLLHNAERKKERKKERRKRKKIPDWWRWEKSTTSKVEQLWIHEERNIFILNIESVKYYKFKSFEGGSMEYALNCSKYLHQLSYYSNNLIFIFNLINTTLCKPGIN